MLYLQVKALQEQTPLHHPVVGVPHFADFGVPHFGTGVDHQDLTGRDIHIEVVQSRNKGQGLFLNGRIMLLKFDG